MFHGQFRHESPHRVVSSSPFLFFLRLRPRFVDNKDDFKFCRWGELASHQTPKLEDHSLSVVRDCLFNMLAVTLLDSGFSGLEVACWPLVPKFAGSNPAEAVGFSRDEKILSTPSFWREAKPFVPCRRFTACERSLNVTWKSGIFRQNSSAISRPSSSSFHY